MRRLFFIVFFLFLCVPVASHAELPGFQKDRMGTISGQLNDSSGKPLKGPGMVSFFNAEKGIPPLISRVHRVPDMLGKLE